MAKADKPVYGNWVSLNMIKLLSAGVLVSICLCIISFSSLTDSWNIFVIWLVRAVLIAAAIVFVLSASYFYICRLLFSYDGKYKVQEKILDYVLSCLKPGKGEILDIGCGNGALAIKAAKKFPSANITGVDMWGFIWDFSKRQCEKNAELEGVSDRIKFQEGNAAKLDFPDEYFDGAVSNFVFHEVKDQADKRLVVKEALRVVKKGGSFAFHDLFLEKTFYGNIEEFIQELKDEGISQVTFVRTGNEAFIPVLLKLRFMLGRIGLIYGIK